MFIDDSACNLSSINLMKFRREDGSFDVERFRAAVRIFITAQEILVDHASYPTDRIAANSHKFRPLGLGYANLGSLLMASGLPYDSEQGRALAAAITAIMHGQAYLTSAEHAAHVGAFDGFAVNREPMLRVMEMHRDAVEAIDRSAPADLLAEARVRLGRVPRDGPQARLSQQPGHRPGPDRHDRLHDGLRHHRRRARHRAGEVQAARRRRDAQDRQPDRADGPAQARLRRAGDPRDPRLHRRARHDRGGAGPEGRAPAGLRLCVRPAAGGPEHPLPGPSADDGGRAAVPLGRDLQDVQRAATRRPSRRSATPTSKAGSWAQGAGDLSRRFEGEPAGEHQGRVERRGQRRHAPAIARRDRLPRRPAPRRVVEPGTPRRVVEPAAAPPINRAASGCRTPGAA